MQQLARALVTALWVTALWLGSLGAVALRTPAQASGFQLREEDPEGMGSAYAGATARADDLATLFYNPAGMTRLSGNQTGVGAAWLMPVSKFSGENVIGGVPTAGTTGANSQKAAPVGAAYFLWDAAPRVRIGLAVTQPFGMRSEYPEDWVGRYQALATDLTDVNFSPSVAFRVNDALSLAAGLQVDWISTRFTNAINFNALVPGAADGQVRVDGEDVGVGWTASALWELDPATRIGLTYRSAIRHAIDGHAQFQGVPAALAGNVAFADSGTSNVITLPDTASLGVYRDLTPRWAATADFAWTHWSVIRDLRVGFDSGRSDAVTQQNWTDTWFMAVGTSYKPTERLTLHFGTAYDMSPVPDQFRNARVPDSDRIWLSGGISYALAPGSRLSLSYAHIFSPSPTIDWTDPTGTGGQLVGRFDNHVDLISAALSVRF